MTSRKLSKKKSTFKKATPKQSKKKKPVRKKATPEKKSKKKHTDHSSTYRLDTDLPESYNRTYLRAMPKDPNWLFVYWEISEETIETQRNKMGIEQFEAAEPVLRLLDITDIDYNGTNAWKYFDTHVHYYANNRYLKVPEPGRTYIIEYGNITPEGTFIKVTQSNVLKTPRDNYSEIIDEEWATADTEELSTFSVNYPDESFGGASDSILPTVSFLGSSDNTPQNSSAPK
jgi:hypothetical protein